MLEMGGISILSYL